MTKPVIGIVLDHADAGSFSARPHYALREDYFRAVENAGGIPVGLGYMDGGADAYLDLIDGLLSPGGEFETPVDWYVNGASLYARSARLQYNIDYIEGALKRNMPVLGICAGMQLLAGVRGCKLVPDLQKHFRQAVRPMDPHKHIPATLPAHKADIVAGTRLHACLQAAQIDVNSHHQEAVVQAAPGVIVSARSPDGTIEAIELADHPGFALGVQWHPEIPLGPADPSARIFKGFIGAAKAFRPVQP
jgi:putative glutamine amidotransferase